MAVFEKHFTLEEANALLPKVREAIEEVQSLQKQAIDAHRRLGGNGGARSASSVTSSVDRIGHLVLGLVSQGIQVKDPARGLVDFPHLREGEEVLLCWEPADGDRIAYWHDLVQGYAGRKPL